MTDLMVSMDKADKRRVLTITDVRASQDLSKTDLPRLMRYLFIPVAWPLTLAAYRLGMSPNSVTVARGVFYLMAVGLMAQSSSMAFDAGLALYVLGLMLDSVDGNLSRLDDRASYFGKFLDGLIDIFGDLLLPLAIAAHLCASNVVDLGILLVAAFGVLCHAVSFITINRAGMFDVLLEAQAGAAGVKTAAATHPRLAAFLSGHGLGRVLAMFEARCMNVIFDIRYVVLLICLLTGQLTAFVLFISAIYMVTMPLLLTSRLAKAYATLDLHRRSRSAA